MLFNFNKTFQNQNQKISIQSFQTADEYIRCRYRLLAARNQYISLHVESIDFGYSENSGEKCENVYWNRSSIASDQSKSFYIGNIH